MGRRTKNHEPTPPIREHFAENVRMLRDRLFSAVESETARNKELARLAHTSLSQVQRIAKAELGVSIDALEKFAKALQCRPQDLVTPYFAYQGVAQPASTDDRKLVGSETFPGRRAG